MPPTSFYFDEGQGATTCDDEVDLLSAEPVVPGKNGPTAREQVLRRQRLEPAPNSMGVHDGQSHVVAGGGIQIWDLPLGRFLRRGRGGGGGP